MLECNELSRTTITIAFTDENGAEVVPATFTFRVDIPSGAEIVPATTVTPTGSTHQLVISAAWNKCLGSRDEMRRVTVVATGLAAAEYLYKLNKLTGAV